MVHDVSMGVGRLEGIPEGCNVGDFEVCGDGVVDDS
jgi:hypothetical protein